VTLFSGTSAPNKSPFELNHSKKVIDNGKNLIKIDDLFKNQPKKSSGNVKMKLSYSYNRKRFLENGK
jgi:hypothetical protein